MCVDRRHPALRRIDDMPVGVARQVERVCSRAFCKALWNPVYKEIHFYRSDPSAGVWQQPVDTEHPWSDSTVDYVAVQIQKACMSDAEKMRRVEWGKRSEASAAEEQRGRERESRAQDYEQALRRNRNKRDMGKHFKGRAVVNGIKEN